MKKKCLAEEECPLARAYDAIGDWWSLLIITRIVIMGVRRFSEIQEDLGMAKNILTARLKKLVDEGILEKVPASDGSAYQEYAATEKGRGLYKVLIAMRQWGEHYFLKASEKKHLLVDRAKGKEVPAVEVRASDGRILGPDEMVVITREKRR